MSRVTEGHVPVLAASVVEWLAVRSSGTYVDATVGAGGHAARVAAQLTTGRLIALDRDPAAVGRAERRLASYQCVQVIHGNYAELARILESLDIEGVDGVLIDAGCSSMQLDDGLRGFSFQEDGPLDMRMDPSSGSTAREYLARISEGELAAVLKQYGDVGPAKRIARAILCRRDAGALERTSDLAAAVSEALDFVRGIPEETRTVFQAIRIAVNDELRNLEIGVRQAITVLRPGGRLVVITFHSGEARVVKQIFREASRGERLLCADGRVRSVSEPVLHILTPKAIAPAAEEVRENPRAASARLRAAELIRGEDRRPRKYKED